MANVVEVVNAITLFKRYRDDAIKQKETHQKEVEDSVSKYMAFLLQGNVIVRDLYAELINLQSNGLMATDELRVTALDECIEMLQELVIKEATPEEYDKGLDDAEDILIELKRKSRELMDKIIHE